MKNKLALKTVATVTAIFMVYIAQAQTKTFFASNHTVQRPLAVWTNVEYVLVPLTQTEPQFAGGEAGWNKFVKEHLEYPQAALDQKIFGDVVVSFTVTPNGSVTGITVNEGAEALTAAAVRLITLSSGKWTPADQNGYKIPFRQQLKVHFVLDEK